MSAYDDDDDDAAAPAPTHEAADMTAYDDDGSEAPTLTRDDGAAADMGAYEDDGRGAGGGPGALPRTRRRGGGPEPLPDDASDDDDEAFGLARRRAAGDRGGVSVSLEDEPSPPFATPREPVASPRRSRAPPWTFRRRSSRRASTSARGAAPARPRLPRLHRGRRSPARGRRCRRETWTSSTFGRTRPWRRRTSCCTAGSGRCLRGAADAPQLALGPGRRRGHRARVRSYPADDAVAAAAARRHDVEPSPVAEAMVRAAPPPTRATEPSDPAADAVAAEADATVEEAAAPGPTLGLGAVARARHRRGARNVACAAGSPRRPCARVLAEVERGHALRSAPPAEAARARARAPSPAAADGLRSRLSQSVVDAKLKADLVPGAAATLAAIRATDEPTARRAATAVASAVRRASDPQPPIVRPRPRSRATSPSAAHDARRALRVALRRN